MKKFLALLMAMVMILAVASIASADEPIVVKYWHNRASGANQDALNAARIGNCFREIDNFAGTDGIRCGGETDLRPCGHFDHVADCGVLFRIVLKSHLQFDGVCPRIVEGVRGIHHVTGWGAVPKIPFLINHVG